MKLDNPWVLAPPWRLGRCGTVMKPDCLILDRTMKPSRQSQSQAANPTF